MRVLLALLLAAAPAFAREVRGRVSHTEEGSEEARKLAGGAYVLRFNVVTETGDVVTLNAQEGITQVFEGTQLTKLGEVRAQARVKVSVDDDCKLDSLLCVAAQIDIEQVSGLTRIEAVKERAAIAEAEAEKPADPGMKALGSSGRDERDAPEERDATCAEGMCRG